MAPLQPAQRVVRDAARVATPLGKDGRAAEVESASLNVNLREPNRSVDSAVDAKIGGIQPLVWVENNVDPVVAHAQRVGHRDRKSTRLNSSHVSISYAVFCL